MVTKLATLCARCERRAGVGYRREPSRCIEPAGPQLFPEQCFQRQGFSSGTRFARDYEVALFDIGCFDELSNRPRVDSI